MPCAVHKSNAACLSCSGSSLKLFAIMSLFAIKLWIKKTVETTGSFFLSISPHIWDRRRVRWRAPPVTKLLFRAWSSVIPAPNYWSLRLGYKKYWSACSKLTNRNCHDHFPINIRLLNSPVWRALKIHKYEPSPQHKTLPVSDCGCGHVEYFTEHDRIWEIRAYCLCIRCITV